MQNPKKTTTPTFEKTEQFAEQENGKAAKTEVIPPKTRLNALVHGVYAKDLVLPWESEEDLKQLHEDFRKDLKPEGRLEEETVFSLTKLHWSKKRAAMMEQLPFLSDPCLGGVRKLKSWQDVLKQVERDADSWLANHQTARQVMDFFANQLRNEVERLKTKAGIGPNVSTKSATDEAVTDVVAELRDIITRAGDKLKAEDLVPKDGTGHSPAATGTPPELEEVLVGLEKLCMLFEKMKLTPATDALKGANAGNLEKMLKVEAAIDTRIDKLLFRLMVLRENRGRGAAVPAISGDLPPSDGAGSKLGIADLKERHDAAEALG